MLKQPLSIGDRIAYPRREDNTIFLNVSEIVYMGRSKNKTPFLQVKIIKSRYCKPGNYGTITRIDRVIKLHSGI